MKKVLFALAFAALMLPASLRAQITAPWEPDFSDPDVLADWTLDPDSSFITYQDAYLMGYYGGSAITPAITIPADGNNMSLMYAVYGSADYAEYNIAGYYAVILHQGANTDTVDAYYTYTGGQFMQMIIPLDSYAGQTINVEFFFENDMFGGSMVAFADVKIIVTNTPIYAISGPSTVKTNEENTYSAYRFAGNLNNVSYSWFSSIGNVTPSNGEEAIVTYTTGGTDTLCLIVTNDYGADTAYKLIEVVECNTITEFPWLEDFEGSDNDCWSFHNLSSDNGMRIASSRYARSGDNVLFGAYNDDEDANQWAISPAITLPANANNFNIRYYISLSNWEGIMTSYEVRVSTTGTDIEDFTNLIHTETGSSMDSSYNYAERLHSLSDFAGQTIYIAFHNMTAQGGDAMWIDDITVGAVLDIESAEEANIAIYPNPVRDMLTVNGENVKNVEIIDVNGRVVLNSNRAGQIDMSELSDGVYMVRVMSENGVSTKKIVKK